MKPSRSRLTPALALARFGLVLAAVGQVVVAAPAHAVEAVNRPADGVFVVDGRGFGHGRGLSQYGAQGFALSDPAVTHQQILSFYYPGTELATGVTAARRVLVTAEDSDLVVVNAPGLVVRDTAGAWSVDAGARGDWSRVRALPVGDRLEVQALQNGAWTVLVGGLTGPVRFEGPAALALQLPSGQRTYRGTLQAARSGQASRPLYVVNTVGLEDYVRGVLPAEMPAAWQPAALRSQAVAARSYGMLPCPQAGGYPATALYDVVDTTVCQAYGGLSAEDPRTNQAVTDSAGQVLRYGGAVLRSEFSASNGGWTVAAGGPFVAKEDPYDGPGAAAARRPEVHRWTGVRIPAGTLESAFGTGHLREVRVLSRDGRGEWGGRVLEVRLVGDVRTVEVTGEAVRRAAGLRSSWFDLQSPIDAKHAALGGSSGLLGAPTIAEQVLVDGRFRAFERGSIYWSPQTGAWEVHGSIRDRWGGLGWERGLLGYPLTDENLAPDRSGRYNHFQNGSVYWAPGTGAWEVYGAIRGTWAALGWERSLLGYPVTGETATPGGRGRYNHFQNGSLYWTPTTCACEVRGAVRDRWAGLRWEAGPLGFPVTNETGTPDGRGRYNHFEVGSVYWTPTTGAHDVRGPVRDVWAGLRWEAGLLGYPVSGEAVTPDGAGRYNHFERGSVYWTRETGAHEVHGLIRQRWAELHWEAGELGYPVSDEYAVPGGRRSDFQGGSLVWDAATGQVTTVTS